MLDLVLDASEAHLAERLRLRTLKDFSGTVRGERLSRKKGLSIEFSDFREYVDGDDLRHLDWNALARLDQAVIRTYQDEQELSVYIALDCTSSMGFDGKLARAQTAACFLGYVALMGGDALTPIRLGSKTPPGAPLRGRSSYSKLARWVRESSESGRQSVSAALDSVASSLKRPGLVVMISDFLDPQICASLARVAGRGHELMLVQVLSSQELEPNLEGDVRLVDAENPDRFVDTTISGQILAEYQARLQAHLSELAGVATRTGGRHLVTTPEQPWASDVVQQMVAKGWLA